MGVEGLCGDSQGLPLPQGILGCLYAYMWCLYKWAIHGTPHYSPVCNLLNPYLHCCLGTGTGEVCFHLYRTRAFPAASRVTSYLTLSSTLRSSSVITFGSQRGTFMQGTIQAWSNLVTCPWSPSWYPGRASIKPGPLTVRPAPLASYHTSHFLEGISHPVSPTPAFN